MTSLLVLNYEFPPLGGGASPVSYEIALGLSKKGFDIDVVTMGYKNLPKFEEVNKNFRIHRVKCLRSKKEICYPHEQLTYLISGYFKARELIKNNDYKVCHTHFIVPTGLLALILKKQFGLSYVVTSHGSDVPGYNPDRFKFLHKFSKPVLNWINKEANLITTPSAYLKELIQKNIGIYRIKVVPNGSIDYYNHTILKENIICTTGRLLKRKGIQHLIKAFLDLNLSKWELYIVGDGPYRGKLVETAESSQNIIFTGWLDNKQKKFKTILNKSKIFALLSSKESQGISLIEAMSAKNAIITNNSTACKETISNGNGFLVKREDTENIKEKLLKLIHDETLLKSYMEKSRNRYKKHYAWPIVISKYINLFKQFS